MTDVYEQITRNKRLSVVYAIVFVTVWVCIGAVGGCLFHTLAGANNPGTAGLSGGTIGASSASSLPLPDDIGLGVGAMTLVAAAGIVFAVTSGSDMVLRTSGARPADGYEFHEVRALVEALAIGEGLPAPAVYVIDDPAPNAFATGLSPAKASITVTTGLLAMMNHAELEGVLAHEMSHIRNYDVRLLLIITTLVGLAATLAGLIWRTMFFARGGRGRNNQQLALVLIMAGVLLAAVGAIFGPIVRMALSRRRESLADVSSAELTRNPAGLASALRKLSTNERPFRGFSQATAAMCIDDPTQRHPWVHHLYDSHPPIESRIALLDQLAGHSLI